MALLGTLTWIFVASSITLYAMHYFKLPAIPGYIVAGLLIAPFVDAAELLRLAQIGVMFLVFIFGLKFDPIEMSSVGRPTVAATVIQLLLIGGVGYGLGWALGLNTFQALLLAVTAGLSSTLIGLDLAEHEIHRRLLHGRLAESTHLAQDVLGLVTIAVLFSNTGWEALVLSTVTFGFLFTALFLRKYLFKFLNAFINFNTELLMLLGFTGLLLAVYAAGQLGIPLLVGAFSAGIAAAKFPYNMELIDTVGSVKDFFAAIFFVTLGALAHFPGLDTLLIAAALLVITTVLKPLLLTEVFRAQGYSSRASLLAGTSLNQVSELALVLAIQAYTADLVSQSVFDGIILAAVGSMMISSFSSKKGELIYSWFGRADQLPDKIQSSGHIVIIGGGVIGDRLAEQLGFEKRDVYVVDNNVEQLEHLPSSVNCVHGDIIDPDFQDRLALDKASLIVSTALHDVVSEEVLGVEGPAKIVYAETVRDAEHYYECGADYVIVPDVASSDVLRERLFLIEKGGSPLLQGVGRQLLSDYERREFS